MRNDVVALYVDPRGPYPKLVKEWYDEARDARTYQGPLPVVAHPPCGPWSSLRHLHTRPKEKPLALHAIEMVQRYGGALEHPATSTLFGMWLPKPGTPPDAHGGRTIELQQCDFGHPARKRTYIYFVGGALPPMPATCEPTHWVSAHRYGGNPKRAADAPPPGIKICSAQQRRRTPLAFAEWLLSLAASAGHG